MTDDNAHLSVGGSQTRRDFLKRSGMVAAVAGFATPFALDLAGIANSSFPPAPSGAVLQTGGGDDYRALVCVFLLGGNDHNATFVPYDRASYDEYRRLRPDLAPARDRLSALGAPDQSGRQLAFTPEWKGLHGVFEAGDLAVVSNVGTLVAPTTKQQFKSVTNRPSQLFSHNDQQTMWQASQSGRDDEGWGGRLADLVLGANGDNSAFTCMSTAGNTTMMTGRSAGQYHVDVSGVTELQSSIGADPIMDGLRDVMMSSTGGLISDAYTRATTAALESSGRLAAALPGPMKQTFPQSSLGQQLSMVARLVQAGRGELGLKRQVFFVAAGGFDTHARQSQVQPGLLADLNGSLTAFRQAMVDMGANDHVTTFTSSDFGRTLTSNGDGTDHGWGSHHIVMGGAVNGRRVIGRLPAIADDGPNDVGRGRLVPTTAVDQYASTLAGWMGAQADQLGSISPNVGRFETSDIGLFAADRPGTNPPPPTTTQPPSTPPTTVRPPSTKPPKVEKPVTEGSAKSEVTTSTTVEPGGASTITDVAGAPSAEGLRAALRVSHG